MKRRKLTTLIALLVLLAVLLQGCMFSELYGLSGKDESLATPPTEPTAPDNDPTEPTETTQAAQRPPYVPYDRYERLLPSPEEARSFGDIEYTRPDAQHLRDGFAEVQSLVDGGADSDHRIDVSITKHLTTSSSGDTNLNALGSLNLTADTTEGILHVDGTENLTIDNTDGDMNLGTEVAKSLFGNAGGGLILATQLIAIFGALNGMIIAFPRYYYEMALDGHFFKNHAKLHPKYAVPHVALFSQAVISIILVLLRNLDQLTSLVVFAGMVYNVLVIIAVIIYRKKFPDMERPYKAWGYPVTVVIAIVLFGALMINTLVEDPMTAIFGLIVPFAGILCWYIFDRRLKKEGKQE